MPGDQLDLSSDPPPPRGDGSAKSDKRRYLGIHFACCDVYSRIYVNREQTAYQGNCPRCSKPLILKIGPGGTDARFFTVY